MGLMNSAKFTEDVSPARDRWTKDGSVRSSSDFPSATSRRFRMERETVLVNVRPVRAPGSCNPQLFVAVYPSRNIQSV